MDKHHYKTGKKVDRAELERVHLQKAEFHADWNNMILPHT